MSSTAVEQIKERLTILDVVSAYVELHKAGKSYKGRSPFTNEKTPSFYVSPDRGMYYCFSSNQGGDMFTFVETMEGVDFKGALKILADKAGVELVAEDPKKRSERDTQYALIEEATKFFFSNLSSYPDTESYITGRGVEGKTIHTWRIGFALDAWRSLKEHLASKGYSEEAMLKAGLIKRTDDAKESYDVFRNRIMFPIADTSGRVVAFSGRTLSKDADTPKYVNSPETELYVKSDVLFGYDKAKQGIRQYDFSLVVEGQFDLVLCHQAGYTNAVAVSGTALTLHHVDLLQRLSNRAVLALDSDRAGIAAVKRSGAIMLKKGMDVKVVHIEGGKDPADIIKDDPKHFKRMVGNATHIIEFLLMILKGVTKDERAYKLQVREEIIPILGVMPNRIDREHFEGVVAEALGSTKDAIHYEVERVLEKKDDGVESPVVRPQVPKDDTRTNSRIVEVESYLKASIKLLSQGEQSTIAKTLSELLTEVGIVIDAEPDTRVAKLLFRLEEQFEKYKEKQLREELTDMATEFLRLVARRELSRIRSEVQSLESVGDHETAKKMLSETKQWETMLERKVVL